MRGAPEVQGDLGDASRRALGGAQVERDASPASRVDVDADRCVGFGRGRRIDAVLVEEALDQPTTLPAGGVLAVRAVQAQIAGHGGGFKHLFLLTAQSVVAEVVRFLHGGQRHQLEEVILDDVAGGTDAVVVARATADADVLGHGDLHVAHEVTVPQWLVHHVGEPERQHILHSLFAEVVVDPEDRLRRERGGDHAIQILRTRQVIAERLLNDGSFPAARLVGQPMGIQLLNDLFEVLRRDRQVEGVVAAGAVVTIETIEGVLEPVERGRLIEATRHEVDTAGQLPPDFREERRPGVFPDAVLNVSKELLVGPITAREPHQTESGRQRAVVGQVVDRRQQLLARQVTCDSEEHQDAWSRDSG